MNKIIPIIILLLITTDGYAQNHTLNELENNLIHYEKLKTNGKKITVAGIVTASLGAAIFLNGMFNFNDSSTQVGNGILIMQTGNILMSVGIPLWANGTGQVNRYNRKIRDYNKKISINLTNSGGFLTYHF